MKMLRHITRVWSPSVALLLAATAALSLSPEARAQVPQPSKPWKWPVYEGRLEGGKIKTAAPRLGLWSSHGEFQEFGSGTDVHPGIDIRANSWDVTRPGDVVVFPATGKIVHIMNPMHCKNGNVSYCRLWVRTTMEEGDVVYYLGHVDLKGSSSTSSATFFLDESSMRLREKLVEAENRGPQASSPVTLPDDADVEVNRGEYAGFVSPYPLDDPWDHVHLGVFDPNDNMASLDPTVFLERNAVGDDGTQASTRDTVRPTIQFVGVTGTMSTCGLEAQGDLGASAHMFDTFTAPDEDLGLIVATHPNGKPMLRSIGISGARFIVQRAGSGEEVFHRQWYTNPVGCSGIQCGLGRLPFRADLRAQYATPADFFAERGNSPPEYAGGDFMGLLYWPGSQNDHGFDRPDEPLFVHQLTHGDGVEQPWRTTDVEDGSYVLIVHAWDFYGNQRAEAGRITVNNAGHTTFRPDDTPGFADIYAKDHERDHGQVPSTLGDAPFWASDDIIIVDRGTSVDGNTPASALPVVAGQPYDVYVRVRNATCAGVSGILATVYTADPASIQTAEDLTELTYAGPPGGVRVGPLSVGVVGPFRWTPTVEEAADGGHRCLLAALGAPSDPAPPAAELWSAVPHHNNVIQRNVQVNDFLFWIRNPFSGPRSLELTLDMGLFPVRSGRFELLVDYDAALEQAWSEVPDAVIYREGSHLVIRALTNRIDLPPAALPPVSQRQVRIRADVPQGFVGPYPVDLYQRLNGELAGGMRFWLGGEPAPPPPPVIR